MENKIELGSEFNLNVNDLTIKENNLENWIQEYTVSWFNFGRSAVKSIYIPQNKRVLLPEFICESVINCFQLEEIIFYKIKEDFDIDEADLISKIDKKVGIIYICHYFGYLQNENLLMRVQRIAKENKIIVIEDTTQSLFSHHKLYGDVALASVRKWLPIPQGAILYSRKKEGFISNSPKKKSVDNYRTAGMICKDLFLSGRYDTNMMYREIFAKCEERIDFQERIEGISDFARFIIRCFDIETLIERRKLNAERVDVALADLGVPNRRYKENECPLVYPIRVKSRDSFRKYLNDKRIYCAVHWPIDNFKLEDRTMAKRNADELISLPIDQRYGDTEIEYLIETIKEYKAEL